MRSYNNHGRIISVLYEANRVDDYIPPEIRAGITE